MTTQNKSEMMNRCQQWIKRYQISTPSKYTHYLNFKDQSELIFMRQKETASLGENYLGQQRTPREEGGVG